MSRFFPFLVRLKSFFSPLKRLKSVVSLLFKRQNAGTKSVERLNKSMALRMSAFHRLGPVGAAVKDEDLGRESGARSSGLGPKVESRL